MVRAIWLAVVLMVACVGARAWGAKPQAAELVRLETVDGRALSGVVDARTDDGTLWLRQEEGGIFLSVPVGWDGIASAMVGGAEVKVEVAVLRERWRELASEGPRGLIVEVEAGRSGFGVQGSGGDFFAGARRKLRVRNVDIVDACLVNLDRDVAPDGLEVSIVAVGDDGAPVAVRGNLRAELFGERRPLLEPEVDFDVLDRWSQRVRAEDFVDGVATYCLPFRQTAPEWQFDLPPDAVLTVQLGASGHGNFSATAPVVLREFNPLRDELQQNRGTRFFENEVQGWRPLGPFGAELGRWPYWGR